ncbi:MAG: ABC transporter permease [Herpetosiphonaceae bacterium]|nr:ABC transporter permease [Herpetosiphonaceae bacterium]
MSTVANTPARVASDVQRKGEASLWRDARRRFFKNKLAVAALVVAVALILTAIFANVIAPASYDYSVIGDALQFPNRQHLLGTDSVGRDFLSRLIYGARISMIVGFSVQAIAVLIGVSLGMLAGLLGGWVDYLIMRCVEVLTAIPGILFALFLISVFGGGLRNVILAIALVGWIDLCRLTRAQFLTLREKDYVLAARSIGTSPFQIATRHLLPNALAPLIVAVTLGIPSAIFTEASLSFLGLGINDPLPSWGKMVADANSYIRVYWHLGLFPTLLIATTMLSFSFVGDGLRDALDPHLNK